MVHRAAPQELQDRDREILKDVIRSYVVHAEPVSSRTVARAGRLGLSAATIRNVMADLEEWGYLFQPHASAGRVPTPAGYHLFIDSLMDTQALSSRERRRIDENLRTSSGDPDRLMEATLLLLKELSHQVSIVLTPALGDTVLRAVEFVPLTSEQVLCVVISASGFVDNKVIQVSELPSREELTWISNYLTENFAGLTLRQIRDRLLALMAEERAQVDRLMSLSIELARHGFAADEERQLLYDGTHELLSQPELSDIHRVRQLFDTFARKARLVAILNQFLTGQGVRVVIGEESDLTSELDFSLLTKTYGVGDRALGSIAIFGPSRMEYPRLIPLVHYLGEALSRVLSTSFAGAEEEH
jgi:heat-inducible transcriptional repressor